MKVNIIFRWFDFWVGLFWDQNIRRLYFFPLPMIGITFQFKTKCPRCDAFYWADLPRCPDPDNYQIPFDEEL